MKLLAIIALVLIFDQISALSSDCSPDICNLVDCRPVEDCSGPNQEIRKGWCDCCDICYRIKASNQILGNIMCPVNCAGFKCPPVGECDGENQEIKVNGGLCGCCDICFTSINEGGKCQDGTRIGGPPPSSGCAKGLDCVNGTCTQN